MDPPNSQQYSTMDILLQNVVAERNALRSQNDQLWRIIEKQRTVIISLQNQLGNNSNGQLQQQQQNLPSIAFPQQNQQGRPSSTSLPPLAQNNMPMQMNINKSGSENSGQYSGAGFGFDNSYNNTSFLPRLQQQPTYDPQQMQYQQQEYLQHQKQQQQYTLPQINSPSRASSIVAGQQQQQFLHQQQIQKPSPDNLDQNTARKSPRESAIQGGRARKSSGNNQNRSDPSELDNRSNDTSGGFILDDNRRQFTPPKSEVTAEEKRLSDDRRRENELQPKKDAAQPSSPTPVRSSPEKPSGPLMTEGYLIKKGKSFGVGSTWKKRYFILDKGLLECYETKNVNHSGTIKLKYCTVSSIPPASTNANDPEIENKFPICVTEYKKGAFDNPDHLNAKDGTPLDTSKVHTRYLFYDHDKESRDNWIKCFWINIELARPKAARYHAIIWEQEQLQKQKEEAEKKNRDTPPPNDQTPHEQGPKPLVNDDTKKSITPPLSPKLRPKTSKGNADENERVMSQKVNTMSAILNESAGESPGSGNFLKAGKSVQSLTPSENGGKKNLSFGAFFKKKNNNNEQPKQDPTRLVFGVSLDKCLDVCKISENFPLPPIIYRCIEYLDAKNAIEEEGIYRLSGSSSEVQRLKDKFNLEGDVDLLGSNEYYDVHAVAGLLKLWFRELDSPVLTNELSAHFSKLADVNDRHEKLSRMLHLLSLLPLPNYTLLRVLVSHLIRVVQNNAVNKMTIRNVSIVFAPTVSVPAGIFTMMMSDFDVLFKWNASSEDERKKYSQQNHDYKQRIGEAESVADEERQLQEQNVDDDASIPVVQKRAKKIDINHRNQVINSMESYNDAEIDMHMNKLKNPMEGREIQDISIEADGTGEEDEVVVIND